MTSLAHAVLISSKESRWRTPRWLFDALNREFNFCLDAAADPSNHLCNSWLGPGSQLGVAHAENALLCDWATLCPAEYRANFTVFCNPPYSRRDKHSIHHWVHKMSLAGRYLPVIGVFPYSTQTVWWRRYVAGVDERYSAPPSEFRAQEIRLFPYRIAFEPPETDRDDYKRTSVANVNTAIVIWRPHSDFVEPWVPQLRYWNPRADGVPARKARGRRSAPGVAGSETSPSESPTSE